MKNLKKTPILVSRICGAVGYQAIEFLVSISNSLHIHRDQIQSNLVIRNFLVTLKLFLNTKCSLSQAFNQSTMKVITNDESKKMVILLESVKSKLCEAELSAAELSPGETSQVKSF